MADAAERFAQGVASRIDRRRFMRRLARGAFFTCALASVGSASGIRSELARLVVRGDTCSGPGPGCPGAVRGNPCGMSRCCNFIRAGAPNNCNCKEGTTGCKENGESPNCYGGDTRVYSNRCWTCVGPCSSGTRYTTTCCDCKTNANHCNDPDLGGNRGRCISYHSTTSNC